ncbi:MAG TPA: DUF2167 domain-containing protein [Myxococcota bacterium]
MLASRLSLVAAVALLATPVLAQDAPAAPAEGGGLGAAPDAAPVELTEAQMQELFKKTFKFVDGPVSGDLGEATIQVPAGYMFAGKEGTDIWSQQTSGRTDPTSRGLINSADGKWMLLFTYDDTGHINDDDKDELDAGALLESYQEGQASANEYRQQQGIEPIFVDGWEQAPGYNESEKLLEWAIKAHSPTSARIVNFNSRLLGRTGVMSAVLMYGDDVQLAEIMPAYRSVLKTFAFKDGQRYSEFRDGDKLAEYGLAALVAGGGVALAAKSGLLSKLGIVIAKAGKLIIVAVVGLGAGIVNLFKRIFGKNDQ